MKRIDLRNILFPQERGAPFPARSDLLARLEDQVNRPLWRSFLQDQRKAAQGGAVAVMPALVRDAVTGRSIGERAILLDRQSVHVCAEGDGGGSGVLAGFRGIEPSLTLYDLRRCVLSEEGFDAGHRFLLLHGKLRVLM